MKKNNKWLLYFLYAMLLLCYMLISHKIYKDINVQKSTNYIIMPYIIWSIVLNIVAGVILGLEKFLLEWKKVGGWKVNWPKVVFLGIPSLLVSFIMLILFIPNVVLCKSIINIYYFFCEFNSNLMQISQIFLGYILITCFIKVKKQIYE